ncbi:MAG TPA: phytanoyl-CoA dioxygenase family protein [Planctomycetota bacterium]|nr:phytanoyl-CoA dioxygenase family protein [Planctomycetota bacterium]
MRLLQKMRLEPILVILDLIRFGMGALVLVLIGRTPAISHRSLSSLLVRTRGRFHDRVGRLLAALYPPYHFPRRSGVLGSLAPKDLQEINQQLDSKGYYVFPERIPAPVCDRIAEKTRSLDALLCADELTEGTRLQKYDPLRPEAPKYLIDGDDAFDMPEIQGLIRDLSLLEVAQNYLRAKPILTGVGFWWSTAVKKAADESVGQKYHFDMERIKWIMFFIYLTDVDEGHGPHCFIEGSHRAGAIPPELLSKGYARISDDETAKYFPKEKHKEFVGRRGTIIAEDSRGLHKGKPPTDGDRLLICLEFSSSTFGAMKRYKLRAIRDPELAPAVRAYPRIYSNFDLSPLARSQLRT